MCISVVEDISGCVLVEALATVLIHVWSLGLSKVPVAFGPSQTTDPGLGEVQELVLLVWDFDCIK